MTTTPLAADRIAINDPAHGHAIARRAGVLFNPAGDQCIARIRDGALIGGVVYTAHVPSTSIAMHVAGFTPDWVNRDMLWVCFHYPFVQLNVKRVFGQVQSTNEQALEFDLKLGFKETARIPEVFPDGDLVVVSMHRDECRWLQLQPRTMTAGKPGVSMHGRQIESPSRS